jgi:indolepyruvate ferredoxin oxidoreductase alpha subunit
VNDRRLRKGKRRSPLTIDQVLCDECSLCVRVLGCPAILVTDGQYTIDEELCDGCELCAHLCQRDAIQPVSEETR